MIGLLECWVLGIRDWGLGTGYRMLNGSQGVLDITLSYRLARQSAGAGLLTVPPFPIALAC